MEHLAKLLATENIMVQHQSVQTASFDLKTRVLTLPIWENMQPFLYDMLTGHEVGHALWTHEKEWNDAIVKEKLNKDILNMVEDPRVDRKIKDKYPGLKSSYFQGYQDLLKRGFFGPIDNYIVSEMGLLDRLNLYFKGGDYFIDIPFHSDEYWAVKAIRNTHSFKDVVEVAKQLQIFLTSSNSEEEDHDEDFLTSRMDLDFVFDKDEDSEDGDDVEIPSPFILDGEDSEDDSDGEQPDASTYDSDKHSVDDADITSQEHFEENHSKLSDLNARGRTYFTLPTPKLKNVVIPHKRVRMEMKELLDNYWKTQQGHYDDVRRFRNQNLPEFNLEQQQKNQYNKFRNSSAKIINYMVKEFERKKAADEYKRTSISRTGVINVNKLHEYKYAEDIFLKRALVNDGKNHGLIMLVDWSASMSNNLHNTIKQTLSLVWFCNKIQIPFEVYAFTDGFTGEEVDYSSDDSKEIEKKLKRSQLWEYKTGDAYFAQSRTRFRLMNLFSSKMSARELNMAALNLWTLSQREIRLGVSNPYELGATPTVEAMMAMTALVPAFKEYYKLDKLNLITLTDGDANTEFSARYRGDSDSPYDTLDMRTDVIYVDPVTNKNYTLNDTNYWRYLATQQVDLLLRVIKDRFKINTIGIFLDNDNRVSKKLLEKYLGWYTTNKPAHQKVRKEIRQHGFCTITTTGFDEYYIIPLGTMEISDNTKLPEEAKGVSKSKLKNIFTKNQKNKFGNRVLANRMMDLLV